VTRVLSGAALIILAVALVWFAPPLVFFLAAEALLVLAFMEYAHLAAAVGVAIPVVVGAVATVAASVAVPAAFRPGPAPVALEAVLVSAVVLFALIAMAGWRGGADALGRVSAMLFPLLYLGLPIGAMIAIRSSSGPRGLFLLMLTVIVSDTAQYYTGRLFGRRPLAPAISPKKTIEGALGGFVWGTVVLAVVGQWWLPGVPVLLRAALGAAVVAAGIAGDLFESMIKRSAGVKDSSALIPGHGGVLDRIDALLFAAPVYYVVLQHV
jgi:phosphatidate cytidylyltransferase